MSTAKPYRRSRNHSDCGSAITSAYLLVVRVTDDVQGISFLIISKWSCEKRFKNTINTVISYA